MTFVLLTLLACFPEITKVDEQRFPDNPFEDYDGDTLLDAEDCDDTNPAITGPIRYYLDTDGDGFGRENDSKLVCPADLPPGYIEAKVRNGQVVFDCDDDNPDVNHDAEEICDGQDNDCNGESDEYGENATVWYGDADGDGFGDPTVQVVACEPPPLYVGNAFDCDDGNPSIRPNAPELCNDGDLDGDGVDDAIDNNCNDVADENSALDVQIWFADADTDGFGSPSAFTYACEQPSGYVDNSSDCNDNNIEIFPGAEEICNGLDDDCDNEFDEGSPTFAPTWYEDVDGDGFGDSNSSHQSCYVPLGYVPSFGDCDDTSIQVYPNAPEFCNNIDNNCDGLVDNNAVDSSIFYLDQDGDGHGVSINTLVTCETVLPSNYSILSDDCDDADPTRSPSQSELCTDTVDENCDGDTTFAAVDLITFYADSDMDGYGNPSISIQLCEEPSGYVDNADDCNDTDSDVQPFMPVEAELCNGKVDRCENQSLSQVDEVDLDGDGYVTCELDVDPLQWEDPSVTPLGGGDCDDGNADRYPGATELCNGIFEDCANVNYDFQPAPDLETDDDGDGFVECTYYASVWASSTVVAGGDDCDDSSDLTYVGAATNYPNLCAQDSDFDGEPDCNLTGVSQDYGCDYGVIYPNGTGPDFVLIPAGVDPLGRYELTRDYYMMTTEVTAGMYTTIMGGTDIYNQLPKTSSYPTYTMQLANQLSVDTGFDTCYEQDGSGTKQEYLYDIASCPGYRLPTEAEWEYAARSGTTSDLWTGSGPDLGGTTTEQGCDYDTVIFDGNLNPYLRDYAWFCGNTTSSQPVAQLLPNGFGLYDMHGNVPEYVNDIGSSIFPYGSFQNPNGYVTGSQRVRGSSGNLGSTTPVEVLVGYRDAQNHHATRGTRLVRTIF